MRLTITLLMLSVAVCLGQNVTFTNSNGTTWLVGLQGDLSGGTNMSGTNMVLSTPSTAPTTFYVGVDAKGHFTETNPPASGGGGGITNSYFLLNNPKLYSGSITLASGRNYFPLNIPMSVDNTALQAAQQPANFIGTITNLIGFCQVYAYALGNNTNLLEYLNTNGVDCGSLTCTVYGTNTIGASLYFTGTGSYYCNSPTNLLCLVWSNTTAGTTVGAEWGASARVVNPQ